jgi:hypothetical protein
MLMNTRFVLIAAIDDLVPVILLVKDQAMLDLMRGKTKYFKFPKPIRLPSSFSEAHSILLSYRLSIK